MEDWKNWHKIYEKSEDRAHIDMMYNLVTEYCVENNFDVSSDDRAEELVAAITKYLEKSRM